MTCHLMSGLRTAVQSESLNTEYVPVFEVQYVADVVLWGVAERCCGMSSTTLPLKSMLHHPIEGRVQVSQTRNSRASWFKTCSIPCCCMQATGGIYNEHSVIGVES